MTIDDIMKYVSDAELEAFFDAHDMIDRLNAYCESAAETKGKESSDRFSYISFCVAQEYRKRKKHLEAFYPEQPSGIFTDDDIDTLHVIFKKLRHMCHKLTSSDDVTKRCIGCPLNKYGKNDEISICFYCRLYDFVEDMHRSKQICDQLDAARDSNEGNND